ncbi:MAG: CoA-transferase, partial [Candidatus Binatia bacterium]|nr:CoA-transferase [Candidatus Binatia bacterium]
LAEMIGREEVEGYILPLGAMTQLYREIASGRPGLVTHVGLHTFVDPRVEGPAQNSISKDELVEVVEIGGEEWLLYKSLPIHVTVIRGTTADEQGNISMEKEIGLFDMFQAAQAAKRWGGKVIAQVERVAAAKGLRPKDVRVPGVLVDAVVVARPENHMQTLKVQYNPAYSGEIRIPDQLLGSLVKDVGRMGHVSRSQKRQFTAARFDTRRIIAQRAALELVPDGLINVGVGAPEIVSDVVLREGLGERIHFTVEHGPIGGLPAYGLNFGAALNPDMLVEIPSLMDFYDGGGIDVAYLGLLEVDRFGNINASRSGESRTAGGFIDISQNAKKVVFCCNFTRGSEIAFEEGKVKVLREGEKKFVSQVRQITFNGPYAAQRDQLVLFVTERAVFRLTRKGLVLEEVAPGIDLERDIFGRMDFAPVVSEELREMSPEVFNDSSMSSLREAFQMDARA